MRRYLLFSILFFSFCVQKMVINKVQIPPVNIITNEYQKIGIGYYYSDYYLSAGYQTYEYHIINKLNQGVYFQASPISHLSLSLLLSSSFIPSINSFLKFKSFNFGCGIGINFNIFLSPYIYLYINFLEKNYNYYFYLIYLTTPNEIEEIEENKKQTREVFAKGYGFGLGFNHRIYKELYFTFNFKNIYLKGITIEKKNFLKTFNPGICILF